MVIRRRWLPALVVTSLLAGTVGCGSSTANDAELAARIHRKLAEQAADALVRWDAALAAVDKTHYFVPHGPMARQIGEWEPAVAANNAAALRAGMIYSDQELTTSYPHTATVTWANGTTRTLGTMPASKALTLLRVSGLERCSSCQPMRVTGVRLSTGTIATTHGQATVPVWEFSLDQTSVRLTQSAVAPSDEPVFIPPTPSDDPYDIPEGVSIGSAKLSDSGNELIVSYPAITDIRGTICANYTFEVVESNNAVVVAVGEFFRHDGSCPGRTRTTALTKVVTLPKPLAARTVLEGVNGKPISRDPVGVGVLNN